VQGGRTWKFKKLRKGFFASLSCGAEEIAGSERKTPKKRTLQKQIDWRIDDIECGVDCVGERVGRKIFRPYLCG
jgi:hypothetical protein